VVEKKKAVVRVTEVVEEVLGVRKV